MPLHVSICALIMAGLIILPACSSDDSRIVNKPFEELEWVERTRSPIALAMSDRHFRFSRFYKGAYKRAVDAYTEMKDAVVTGSEGDIRRMIELREIYEGYRLDLIANLKAVLFFKPDHRPAIYELISLLEDRWYDNREDMQNPFRELADLEDLDGVLRQASDFFGRDYEVNYKLGAVLYRRGILIGELKDRGFLDDAPEPVQLFKDAQVFLRKCIAVRSTYAEAYHMLALCLEKEGRDKEAYKFWKLITVIEQAHLRELSGEIPAERDDIYETARSKVEELGKTYGES